MIPTIIIFQFDNTYVDDNSNDTSNNDNDYENDLIIMMLLTKCK